MTIFYTDIAEVDSFATETGDPLWTDSLTDNEKTNVISESTKDMIEIHGQVNEHGLDSPWNVGDPELRHICNMQSLYRNKNKEVIDLAEKSSIASSEVYDDGIVEVHVGSTSKFDPAAKSMLMAYMRKNGVRFGANFLC
jgi:hypothetical protein